MDLIEVYRYIVDIVVDVVVREAGEIGNISARMLDINGFPTVNPFSWGQTTQLN